MLFTVRLDYLHETAQKSRYFDLPVEVTCQVAVESQK